MLRGVCSIGLFLLAAFAVVAGAQEINSGGAGSVGNAQNLVNDARVDHLNTIVTNQAATIATLQGNLNSIIDCMNNTPPQLYDPIANTTPPHCVNAGGGGAPTITNRIFYLNNNANPCTNTALHGFAPANTTCVAVPVTANAAYNLGITADICSIRALRAPSSATRNSIYQNGTIWYLSYDLGPGTGPNSDSFVGVSCMSWPASGPLVSTPAPPVCNSPNGLNWDGTAWSCNAAVIPPGTLVSPNTPTFPSTFNLGGLYSTTVGSASGVPGWGAAGFTCQPGYSVIYISVNTGSVYSSAVPFCRKN
jgi:uncharacterized coiled-coil protein SlyX